MSYIPVDRIFILNKKLGRQAALKLTFWCSRCVILTAQWRFSSPTVRTRGLGVTEPRIFTSLTEPGSRYTKYSMNSWSLADPTGVIFANHSLKQCCGSADLDSTITLIRIRILIVIWCWSGGYEFLFYADPDPTFHPDADPDLNPDPSFKIKAQTLGLSSVNWCGSGSGSGSSLLLCCETRFLFDADADPGYQTDADPDPQYFLEVVQSFVNLLVTHIL